MNVLLKYYERIRDQFFRQISNPATYPAIDWIDFTNNCEKWEVFDKNFKVSDADRVFIATNVEVEEQEALPAAQNKANK